LKEKVTRKKRGRSLGLSFFLVALPVSLILAFILFSMIVFFVFKSSYSGWERKFEDTHLSSDVVKVDKSVVEEISAEIKVFQESTKEVDFIEINDSDFIVLLAIQINENLPSRARIINTYSETNEGFWMIYYQVKIDGFGTAWIYFDLNKDEVESTDLYVTDVKVGNISVKDLGGDRIVENINNGIKDSMILLTEEGFTGRTIRNIELDEESIIIKGEK
jgi:hypothetical protein